jgi:hypothetical protein
MRVARQYFLQPEGRQHYGNSVHWRTTVNIVVVPKWLGGRALHGMTGLLDEDLYSRFSITGPSENISIYIKNNVLSSCPTFR